METDKEIMAFSQSEKVKSGIIWVSQTLGMIEGLSGGEKTGSEKTVIAILNMIVHEVNLARTISEDERWEGIGPDIDNAILMINSGVSQEAITHLSRALSKVTNIGQQSMLSLRGKKLL